MEADGEWEASIDILQELRINPPCIFLPDGSTAPSQMEAGRCSSSTSGGIEEARRQNLTHAAGEMAELLVSIGDVTTSWLFLLRRV